MRALRAKVEVVGWWRLGVGHRTQLVDTSAYTDLPCGSQHHCTKQNHDRVICRDAVVSDRCESSAVFDVENPLFDERSRRFEWHSIRA